MGGLALWLLRALPKRSVGAFKEGGLFRTNPFRGPKVERPGKFGRPDRRHGPPKPEMGPPRPTFRGGAGPGAKGGIIYRNPKKSLWAGVPLAGTASYYTAKGLLEPEKKPTEESTVPTPDTDPDMRKLTEEQPSMSPGHRAAYLKKRRSRIKKGMKRLLNQYMIIAAVNPDGADEFMKSGMKMMEMDQEFNDDIYMQDAYDSIFQEGNMPTSGRDAFERLVNVVGYKDASDVSGVYKDLVPDYKPHLYSTKGEFKLQKILTLPRDEAISAIIGAWESKQFVLPSNLETVDRHTPEGQKIWYDEAAGTLDLIKSGGIGGTGVATGEILGDREVA